MSLRWLIRGSSRGLGRALSEAVLLAGHRLVATARDPRQLVPLSGRHGDAIRTVPLDVTDPDAAQQAVQVAMERYRPAPSERVRSIGNSHQAKLRDECLPES